MRKIITYPIEQISKLGSETIIKAGIKNIDQNKMIIYEGISIKVPNLKSEYENMVFVVTGIGFNEKKDNYLLYLHSHEGNCCKNDIITEISKEIIEKWTNLGRNEIDSGLKIIHIGFTYNLLMLLPRIIVIADSYIQIEFGHGSIIDPFNICNKILQMKYPMDNS